MQCLYCEAPLKNFRGLFDEDFCSREHRDKYSASFRKALLQLPETESRVAPPPLFSDSPAPAFSTQETVLSEVRPAPRAPEVQTVTVSYLAPEAALEASQPPPSVEADFRKTPLAALCSPSPVSIRNASFALWNASKPVVPFSSVAAQAQALRMAGAIDPTLYALQLVSSPVSAAEFPLAHEGFFPAFTPSGASMSADEQAESEPHEMAPALVINAGPVTSTFSSPARSPEMMPPAFGIASARPVAPAQFNVPGLSLNASTHADTIADISMPHQKAANPAAHPHSHEPLRATFGSSVRIKNWRLRINFAKPA